MACRTGCLTKDHKSWGECARAARIGVGTDVYQSRQDHIPGHLPQTQKAWDRELELFRSAKDQGMVPDNTTTKAVHEAMDFSDKHGRPYQGQQIDQFTKETTDG